MCLDSDYIRLNIIGTSYYLELQNPKQKIQIRAKAPKVAIL